MNIISQYIDLCLFKASPAELPASDSLLKLTLLVYFLTGVALSYIDNSWIISIFTSLADMLFMMIAVALLLKFRGFQTRYQQSLSALAGTGVCIGIVGTPIMIWFNRINEAEQATSLAMIFVLALMFWSLMVTAHIFRQTLEIKPSSASILTVAYTLMSILISGLTMSGVT